MPPRLSGLCRAPRLSGRPDAEDIEARLLGRLFVGSREEGTPKDRRLTPASRAALLIEEAAEACDVRFRLLLIVTLFGM
jgi:hypothetical protein